MGGDDLDDPAAPLDVFISHRRDGAGARELHAALREAGISSFLDEQGIDAGSPFPERLADAMLGARVVVAFLDDGYLERPWCIYELRVALAPLRATSDATMNHLIVALPDEGGVAVVTDRLPPVVASISWPKASDTASLVALVGERLALCPEPLGASFAGVVDDAVLSLRSGALVPAPARAPGGATHLVGMPASLKDGFVGRTDLLWSIHDALDPGGADHATRSCAIEGSGGTGKSQLAAEYVSRYGRRHYAGGCIWIDAAGGDDHLARQLHAVARALDGATPPIETFGERSGDRVEALSARLRETVPATNGGRILWVVDDVPEPGVGGQAPQPLRRWCPVRDRVALLCTSRRAGIKDAEVHIAVRDLAVGAAIRLLTLAPVEPGWLEESDWRRVARWLGCWPLGLKIAQASLGDGYLTAKSLLRMALGEEPARALDSEVEALREDIVEDHLRGVAEIFRRSYDALASKPGARHGAHLLARLARVPLSEDALDPLIAARDRGVLAKRSWIEPIAATGDGGDRQWGMHRVIASYLRCVSDSDGSPGEGTGPEAEFIELCGWIERMLAPPPLLAPGELTRNLRVVADGIRARWNDRPSADLVSAARNMALSVATWRLDMFDLRAPRFYASSLAAAVGADAPLVARLRNGLASDDEEVARSCVAAAGGMGESEIAAGFLLDAVRDPRRAVRWQVTPTASQFVRADVLAVPLIREIFARADEWPEHVSLQLDPLLESAEVLPRVVEDLGAALREGAPPQRRLAAQLLDRALRAGAGRLSTEDARGICQGLVNAAQHDPDRDVARAASEALAGVGDQLVPALASFLNNREAMGDDLWRRTVELYVAYLVALERPPAPRFDRIVDDGESTYVMYGWPRVHRVPERYEPLARIAVDDPEPEVREFACRALLGEVFGQCPSRTIEGIWPMRGGHDCWLARSVAEGDPSATGRVALAECVNEAIDAGRDAEMLPLAELAIGLDPEFVSGYWWRARIRERQQELEASRDDYSRVIELSPAFVGAWCGRGRVSRWLGDAGAARRDLGRAIEIDPEDAEARFERAELLRALDEGASALEDIDVAVRVAPDWAPAWESRAGILGSLHRWKACIEAATRALELDAPMMPSLYYRVVGYTNEGRVDDALRDLDRAIAHVPDDARLTTLRESLRPSET